MEKDIENKLDMEHKIFTAEQIGWDLYNICKPFVKDLGAEKVTDILCEVFKPLFKGPVIK